MHAPIPVPKNKIQIARKKLKLTQNQLADLYNQYLANHDIDLKPVSYATISRWESGTSSVSSVSMYVLSKILNVDQTFLAGYQKEPKSSKTKAIETMQLLTFSDEKKFDRNIKLALSDIIANLYDEIDDKESEIEDLQHQIDTINDPSSDEDPY